VSPVYKIAPASSVELGKHAKAALSTSQPNSRRASGAEASIGLLLIALRHVADGLRPVPTSGGSNRPGVVDIELCTIDSADRVTLQILKRQCGHTNADRSPRHRERPTGNQQRAIGGSQI
jgi:hypothetical protein